MRHYDWLSCFTEIFQPYERKIWEVLIVLLSSVRRLPMCSTWWGSRIADWFPGLDSLSLHYEDHCWIIVRMICKQLKCSTTSFLICLCFRRWNVLCGSRMQISFLPWMWWVWRIEIWWEDLRYDVLMDIHSVSSSRYPIFRMLIYE